MEFTMSLNALQDTLIQSISEQAKALLSVYGRLTPFADTPLVVLSDIDPDAVIMHPTTWKPIKAFDAHSLFDINGNYSTWHAIEAIDSHPYVVLFDDIDYRFRKKEVNNRYIEALPFRVGETLSSREIDRRISVIDNSNFAFEDMVRNYGFNAPGTGLLSVEHTEHNTIYTFVRVEDTAEDSERYLCLHKAYIADPNG
jgi:hypothetical protein